MPGAMIVVLIFVSETSWRRPSAMACTAHLVAEYSEPGRFTRPATEPVTRKWPASCFLKWPSDGADGQRRAVDVGVDHRAPVLRALLQEPARGAEAGVGEEGVQTAELLQRGGHGGLLVVPLGHVAAHGQGGAVAQLGGQVVDLVLGARGQHHAPSVGGRGAGGGGADSAAGAGDQEDGAVG